MPSFTRRFLDSVRSASRTRGRQRRRALSRGRSTVSAECLEHRQLLSAAPGQPVVDSLGADPAAVTWNDDTAAATWEIWIDNTTTNTNGAIRDTGLTNNSFSLADHRDPGVYRVWVRASNEHGDSVWSRPEFYTIDAQSEAPDRPAITMPDTISGASPAVLTWTESARSQYHEVWVRNISTGEDRVVHVQNLQTNSYMTEDPLDAGEYRIWARTKNTAGHSEWSNAFDFTVILQPGQPVIQQPSQSPTSVNWEPVAAAESYEIWADNLTTGETGLIRQQDITTTSVDALGVWKPGLYRVWVRAHNATGHGQWSVAVDHMFSSATEVPERPTVNQPDSSQRHDDPVVLSWSQAQDAEYYEVWIDNRTTGNKRIVHVENLQGTGFVTESPLGVGDFRVWVRAKNSIGNGQWSQAVDFTIDEAPPRPGQTSFYTPGQNPEVLIWRTLPNADSYEVRADNLTTGETDLIHVTGITGNSIDVRGHWKEGRYRVRVRGTNGEGNGPWSEPVEAIVDDALRRPEAPQDLEARQTDADRQLYFQWDDGVPPRTEANAAYFEVWVGDLTNGGGRVLHAVNLSEAIFGSTYYWFFDDFALPVGTYRVWVRGSNAFGVSQWSKPYDFAVLDGPPAKPVIAGHRFENDRDLVVSLTPALDGHQYHVLIENLTDSGGTDYYLANDRSGELTIRGKGDDHTGHDLRPRQYRVWIRAVNRIYGSGDFSEPYYFESDYVF